MVSQCQNYFILFKSCSREIIYFFLFAGFVGGFFGERGGTKPFSNSTSFLGGSCGTKPSSILFFSLSDIMSLLYGNKLKILKIVRKITPSMKAIIENIFNQYVQIDALFLSLAFLS